MLQLTGIRDEREVGTVEVDETTGSADEIEERIRLGTQRLGRIALELTLQDVSTQTPPLAYQQGRVMFSPDCG